MLSIKDLAADRRTVAVPYGEHEVHITYAPSKVNTGHFERTVNEPMSVILADLIEKWDVIDADEQPYPTTREALGALAIGFQQRCLTAIQDDARLAGLPEVSANSPTG